MTPVILKKPRVESDLNLYFDFIAQDKLKPAERFLLVARESFDRLAARPGIGKKWQSPNVRLSTIHIYPMPSPYRSYLIFYRPIPNGIEVLAIMHGARDLKRQVEDIDD